MAKSAQHLRVPYEFYGMAVMCYWAPSSAQHTGYKDENVSDNGA